MSITLKPDNKAWLEQQVKDGILASVDDGADIAVETLMAIQTDDLAWAKPLVDEARDDVTAGRVSDAASFIEQLRKHAVR